MLFSLVKKIINARGMVVKKNLFQQRASDKRKHTHPKHVNKQMFRRYITDFLLCYVFLHHVPESGNIQLDLFMELIYPFGMTVDFVKNKIRNKRILLQDTEVMVNKGFDKDKNITLFVNTFVDNNKNATQCIFKYVIK